MAKFKGKDFLVQRETATPGTYATVGGMRSTSMKLNNESVDVTDKDGDSWRELLAGAGVQSMEISLAGVFSDDQIANDMQSVAMANTIGKFKLISGNGDYFIGLFQVTAMDRGGEYNKEETYSITLASAGTITWTP